MANSATMVTKVDNFGFDQ